MNKISLEDEKHLLYLVSTLAVGYSIKYSRVVGLQCLRFVVNITKNYCHDTGRVIIGCSDIFIAKLSDNGVIILFGYELLNNCLSFPLDIDVSSYRKLDEELQIGKGFARKTINIDSVNTDKSITEFIKEWCVHQPISEDDRLTEHKNNESVKPVEQKAIQCDANIELKRSIRKMLGR